MCQFCLIFLSVIVHESNTSPLCTNRAVTSAVLFCSASALARKLWPGEEEKEDLFVLSFKLLNLVIFFKRPRS